MYPSNRPWRSIDVFPVRYEHLHMSIKSNAISVTGRGYLGVFPVRYEHLHTSIKSNAISVTGRGCLDVFPVRYEHLVHTSIKSNAITITGRGCLGVFPVRYEHLHIRRKVFPVTGRGGTGCALLPKNVSVFLSLVLIYVRR
jgi:hypothetical protein